MKKSKYKKYFSVKNKTKLLVRKDTPKGTYKVTLSVTAKGNKEYKKKTVGVTVTVKIVK